MLQRYNLIQFIALKVLWKLNANCLKSVGQRAPIVGKRANEGIAVKYGAKWLERATVTPGVDELRHCGIHIAKVYLHAG